MREVASNILIHREYVKSFPARIIIEKSRILAENGNRALRHGLIDPDDFTPDPKNPVIAGVFKEIGLADELGSGVRNLFKYTPIFANSKPELFEEDVFKVIIPVKGLYEGITTEQAERTKAILSFCGSPRTTSEIMKHVGLSHREHFRAEVLTPLLKKGILVPTIPDKPNSSNQKICSKKENGSGVRACVNFGLGSICSNQGRYTISGENFILTECK